MKKLYLILTFLLFVVPSIAQTITPDANNVIYVNTAVTGGTGDGSSWANAIPELADALKYARTQYNANNTVYDTTPLQIYVAKGTYKPLYHAANASFTTNGTRNNAFVMVKNVQIYGGFDPDNNITDLTHNRILPNNNATVGTILSGDIGTPNNISDNAYHVIVSSGNVGNALLNGVSITQGNANGGNSGITVNGNTVRRDTGGGMANFSSSPVLTHVNITNNTADYGGGMDNASSSSPVLTNINITNNTAIYGGGMYNYSFSSPILTNVNITNNTANSQGGGMYNDNSSSPRVYNSIIYGNTATTGDNVYNNYNSTPRFYNSLIEGSGGSTAWSTTFGTDGGNNIVAVTSPFTDAANSDYSLAPGSPAIDTGNNQYWINQMGPITGNETDFAGNPRIVGSSIDMGVYEYQPIQITPDANNILYVNTAVIGGTGDGSSWANAIPELADALKYARTEYNADNTIYDTTPLQIYVAIGTYKPLYHAANASFTTNGSRDNSFVMVKNVQIYGGFDPANNITDLTHNRILPDNNATVGTILSGDIGTINDNTDNAYHVVISSGNVGNALLNGVTITQGNANGGNSFITVNGNNEIYRTFGGGVYNSSSSPVLTHVNITNNTADTNGGGMRNYSSSPVLTDVNITDNKAIYGGGILNHSSSSPVLTNVNITDNTANSYGGGMYNYSSSSPQVYNSIVYGNTKADGSEDNLYNNSTSAPQFYNSLIEGSGGSTAWVASFGTDGGNNIDATTSPFTDAANGDYSLAPGSPAIDAGNNQYWINQMGPITGNETDFAGNPRIVGSSIDMGVYEYQCNLIITPTQVNVLCNGANTGLVSVTVSGGVAPYTYIWDNGITSTSHEATDLSAGIYTVTIEDANGCTTTETFTITEPTALDVVSTQIDVLCNGANTGLASVTVSGGVAPYTYTWDNGITLTSHEATDLSAGIYTVTIEDANGCTTTETFTITEPTALDVVSTQVDVLCNGVNTGLANVTVSGGVAPYTYTWDNGITSTSHEAIDLSAGIYTVTIEDANGCTTTETFTITEPTALDVVSTQIDVLCNGANTGLASVTVSGGVAPYTYTWDNGITSTTHEATDLSAGTYTVTIEDANGCTATETFTITEPTALDVVSTQVDVLCNGANTGLASVTVSGGVAPYTYTWDNGITSTTHEATDLSAGTYTVTIEDANGCTTTETFTITEPTALDVVSTQIDVLCNGANTGLASVTVSGGVAPYTYTWDNGITSTTHEATDLSAGTYTVTIEDANGCTTTETFTITEPAALDVVSTQVDVLCNGANTGLASVTVSGGVAPYTYTWDNGITSTTNEATDLSAGTYTVTIEDANGCTTTETFTITEPAIVPAPIVTTPVSYTYGDTASALDALADNGNTLLWYEVATGGLGSTNAFIPTTDSIGTQTYWVSQLTADGCESERVAIEVNVNPAVLIVMADENQSKIYGSADPVFTYTATGFQFNDNNSIFTGLLSRDSGENVGTYTINQGSLNAGPAYTITFVEAAFNITAAELIVTPNNGQVKVYGSADPVYQYTVSGFVAGDSSAVISGLLGRMSGENVGSYLYHVGTLTSVNNNYMFTVLPEYFIITPAPIDVVVDPGQYKMYGTADPVFSYSATGLVNGDSLYAVFTGALQRSVGEEVGIYAINQGTLQANTNYELVSFTGADFEIVPAIITGLQLNDATYVYDGTPKSLVVTGLVDPNAQITYTGNNQINAGTYTVTATVDYGSNYQQLVLTATLIIVRADQTILFEVDSPVILEDTPPFNLQATATSGLPVHYTYTYSGTQPADISASGAVELLAPGEVYITAHQEGDNNYNAAATVTRTLVIESRDSSIWDLYIDDEHFAQPADEIFVIKGCDETNSSSVEIRVETQIGVTVSPSQVIIVPTPDYGIYEVEIVVTSQNGQHTKTYKVIIDKRLPWENVLMQKYDNVVFVNNNPATNGGYRFVSYEWYKNGVQVADQQLFSEGATMNDLLDPSAQYHAVLYTDDGKVFTTCFMTIMHRHDYALTVYPNPIAASGMLNVRYDAPEDQFRGSEYIIFSTSGQLIKRGRIEQSISQISLPLTLPTGTYILMLKANGENKSVHFIVK